jgi:septal ring factor EnvC (AmiA/AmiB activator)
VGILKQLLEDMEKELADMTSEEQAAISEFNALVAAKQKEIGANTEAVEEKTARNGEVAVKIVNLKNDLSDAQDALEEDQTFYAELKKGCANAESEYQERKKMRGQESVAISETIKILNDDDALDLFKKTLPSPSFLQLRTETDMRDEALSRFQDLPDSTMKTNPQLGLIQLALMGKKVSFDKIVKMIDDLTVVLKEEQKEDEKQKEWCEAEFEKSEDKDGELTRKITGLASSIEEMKEGVATLTDDIKALTDGIAALDKSVAEATETRKAENAEFTTVSAQNNAAVQLLGVAENRLNKFYNPAAYQAPQRRELTEEERIYVQSGGADPRDAEEAAAAQTGIAGTGITVFSQAAPPPPPATAGAYKKKDAGGPVALIKKLTQDLKMEMQANEIDEKNAQEDYEELMADSAKKRAGDSKTITEKESQKAGLEGDLEQATKDHKAASAEKMALGEYVAQLHGNCDFLLKNFDLRREARSNEIDAMQKAKAVLGGADYSFVQVSSFLQRK